MSELNPKDDAELELPETLRRALVDLHTPTTKVPAHVDHAILGRARIEYRGRRRMWVGTRWAAIALAAAAMVVIAIHLLGPVVEGNKSQLAKLGDVNHDNQVNILDAYIVARHIARHEPLDKAWDINGDGVVDQKDVDLIAAMAVEAHDPDQVGAK
jgi:hypothetical protein